LLFGAFFSLVVGSPAAASADAGTVFFGGWYEDPIGRVGFDGSNPDPNLIEDDGIAQGITVSGDYLYWQANSYPVRIGRSRLDGTEVQSDFIMGEAGLSNANGLSVSEGRLYWSETRNSSGFGPSFLSSANLDGSGLATRQQSLGPNATGPVIVTQGYVIFVHERDARGITHWSIVRRKLGGRGGSRRIATDRPLISDTLVSRDNYLYWVEAADHGVYIARASLDGSSINTRFRRVPDKGCHARSPMQGGAISSRYYFIGCESGRIDRVSMNGSPRLRQLRTRARLGSGPVLAATP